MRPSVLRIEIDGKSHTELSDGSVLHEVIVEQALNEHWFCRVLIRKTKDERFPIEDCLGKDLYVVAFDENGNQLVLFGGMVLEAELEFEAFGSYTARIVGVTNTYRLDQSMRHEYFRKKTMQQIAEEVVADDNLTVQVTDIQTVTWDPGRELNYVQWGQSDYDFLIRLADDNWAWTRPMPNGIEICGKFQEGATLKWLTEDGLLKFSIKGKLGQPAFDGVVYNIRDRELEVFESITKEPEFFDSCSAMADAVKRESPLNLTTSSMYSDCRAPSPTEYRQYLEKESARAIGSGVTGKGSSRNAELMAGDLVTIEGVGEFNGQYGVTRVTHRWNLRGYSNEFECTTWKHYSNPKPPTPHQIHGVIPAVVTQHNDPRRLGRIQIQYNFMDQGETAWARMTFPHAGSGRGFVFMPEVGDEVLVAFENADPERPYVIGCLFNGGHQQPAEGFRDQGEQAKGGANPDLEENYVKRIFTKSGIGIQFADNPNDEMLSLIVPGGMGIYMWRNHAETGRPLTWIFQDEGDIILEAPKGRIHMKSKWLSRDVGA